MTIGERSLAEAADRFDRLTALRRLVATGAASADEHKEYLAARGWDEYFGRASCPSTEQGGPR